MTGSPESLKESLQTEAQAQLDALLALAPKREMFQTEEEYQEANDGFKHRAGPVIRTLRSLASPAQ
jgi:hypothetical protein